MPWIHEQNPKTPNPRVANLGMWGFPRDATTILWPGKTTRKGKRYPQTKTHSPGAPEQNPRLFKTQAQILLSNVRQVGIIEVPPKAFRLQIRCAHRTVEEALLRKVRQAARGPNAGT